MLWVPQKSKIIGANAPKVLPGGSFSTSTTTSTTPTISSFQTPYNCDALVAVFGFGDQDLDTMTMSGVTYAGLSFEQVAYIDGANPTSTGEYIFIWVLWNPPKLFTGNIVGTVTSGAPVNGYPSVIPISNARRVLSKDEQGSVLALTAFTSNLRACHKPGVAIVATGGNGGNISYTSSPTGVVQQRNTTTAAYKHAVGTLEIPSCGPSSLISAFTSANRCCQAAILLA